MKISLSTLPKIVTHRKKRLGRGLGSGKGAKSGRGTTRHQKARENIPLHFEGGQGRSVKKYPLLRGKGKNKSRSIRPYIVYIKQLSIFNDGDLVNIETLQKKGIISVASKKITVKLLANGDLSKRLTVQLPVSHSAKQKIEQAGGAVETV